MVIAIIGILAAMLLPALGKAREKARNTSCVNINKSLGTQIAMYRDDYEGMFMPYTYKSDAGNWIAWSALLWKCGNIEGGKSLLCPSNASGSVKDNYRYNLDKSASMNGSGKDATEDQMKSTNWQFPDYGYNWWGLGTRISVSKAKDTSEKPVKDNEVKNPAATIMLGEVILAARDADGGAPFGYYKLQKARQESGTYGNLRARHGNSLNICWADAHVSSETVPNPANAYENSIFTDNTNTNAACLWDCW